MLFARRAILPASAGCAVIDAWLSVHGDLAADGTIRIDGRIDGSVRRADTVVIGASAMIVGCFYMDGAGAPDDRSVPRFGTGPRRAVPAPRG